ncbi:MAG TPA: alpha-ketoglutarate-dependent dioxygenase AlkB [Nitrospiraceae bacterium]|nr:alpha-ketoglutarate-dependent dioxygenase AlkB [Nitrospiraceae bacterium]
MAPAGSTDLPSGFRYIPDFLSEPDERELIRFIETLSFAEIRMHGVTAKRRTVHFGWLYGYESWKIAPGPPIPEALLPLRERAARLINQPADAIEEVLVTDYPPGAGIGWHRDAPTFGPVVVGISLLGTARFRFRRKTDSGLEVAESFLKPRSAYVLSGAARALWQHSIPAMKQRRYSVTFRTLKRPRGEIDARAIADGIPIPARTQDSDCR